MKFLNLALLVSLVFVSNLGFSCENVLTADQVKFISKSVTNRKTQDKIVLACVNEECSLANFVVISAKTGEICERNPNLAIETIANKDLTDEYLDNIKRSKFVIYPYRLTKMSIDFIRGGDLGGMVGLAGLIIFVPLETILLPVEIILTPWSLADKAIYVSKIKKAILEDRKDVTVSDRNFHILLGTYLN